MSKILDRLADLKAQQERGQTTICPRCGQDTMKPLLHTNALSRVADIMICDTCGTDEAKLAFMHAPSSLYSWAGLQPRKPLSDFKDTAADTVLQTILTTQVSTLREFFQRSLTDTDSQALRFDALEALPGLTQLWACPFDAHYTAKDGVVAIRFRSGESGIEFSADIIRAK